MRASTISVCARRKSERAWWIELACMTGHYVGWVVIPTIVWGPLAIAAYLAIWAIVGVFLALIFAPAHMGMPIVGKANHEWEHQLATTRDLALPRLISFFFIGLDYQVEHHLFPRIPHHHLPLAARITLVRTRRTATEGVERVHVVLLDQLAAELDAADRVAVLVESR